MILNIHNIYTKYLNQANHADNQCKEIQIITLGLEQKLQISNNKSQEAITLLEAQLANQINMKELLTQFKTLSP